MRNAPRPCPRGTPVTNSCLQGFHSLLDLACNARKHEHLRSEIGGFQACGSSFDRMAVADGICRSGQERQNRGFDIPSHPSPSVRGLFKKGSLHLQINRRGACVACTCVAACGGWNANAVAPPERPTAALQLQARQKGGRNKLNPGTFGCCTAYGTR